MIVELSELAPGKMEGTAIAGKIVTVGERRSHQPSQGGTNYYQDVGIVDLDDANETTVTLTNRMKVSDRAIGQTIEVTTRSGQNYPDAEVVYKNDTYFVKTKKGADIRIGGAVVEYSRTEDGAQGGGGRGSRGSGERGGRTGGNYQSKGGQVKGLTKEQLVSHLTACQDIAADLARRQAKNLGIKVHELCDAHSVTANQVVMACRDQGLVLEASDPLQGGDDRGESGPF